MNQSQLSFDYNRYNRKVDDFEERNPNPRNNQTRAFEQSNFGFGRNQDLGILNHVKDEKPNRGFISGEHKEEGRQCLYICPLIFFLITLMLSILAIIYNSKINFKGFHDAQDSLKYLASNLQKPLFESALAVDISTSCPNDYFVENLGVFRGIKSGCICPGGDTHTKAYCILKGNSIGCKYFNGAGVRDIQFWKAHKICVKKYVSWKFVPANETCEKMKLKKCQANVCVQGDSCPVTSIKITKVDPAHKPVNTATKKQYPFSEGVIFEEIKNVNDDPYVGFDSEFSSFPCVSNRRNRPQAESKKSYPLNRIKQESCGDYGNIAAFSEKIDQSKSQPFFVENGLEFVFKQAPFYSDYVTEKDDVLLFGVRRIAISSSQNCLDIRPGAIHELVFGLRRVVICVYVFASLVLLVSGIGLILSLLFLTLRDKIKFLNSKKGLLVLYVLAFIVIFFAILLFACFCHYYFTGEVANSRNHFDVMIDNKCFKDQTFEKAADQTRILAERISKYLTWIIFTLFAFSLVWLLFFLIIAIIRKRKQLEVIPNPSIL